MFFWKKADYGKNITNTCYYFFLLNHKPETI